MHYLIEGLDPAPFQSFFGLDEEELQRRNARRVTADARPGYPCRVTLDEAEPGETLILLNHSSRDGDTPYRARHAIFIRETAKAAAIFRDIIPPVLATRHLSLRGFDAGGMMVDAMLTEPGAVEGGLLSLFRNQSIVEIDIHNAVRGCFAARAQRA